MGGSSSQQPVTQQTTQSKDPWSVAQPYLSQGMANASSLYSNDVGYQPWPYGMQAAEDPNLVRGLSGQAEIANQSLGGTAGVRAGQAQGLNMIQNQGLSPEVKSLYDQISTQQNPYLQDILNTSNRQIGDRVNSSMSGAGRYGSGAHTDVMARSLAEAANPILAQDYSQRQQQRQSLLEGGLNRAGQWAQLMPTLDAAQYAPSERLASIGKFETDRQQQVLDDQIKQYNAAMARPWEQLARYNAIIGGAGGLGGSSSSLTSSTTPQPGLTQSLFGGALAGAGLGASFGGLPGAGVGAVGGGLLGLLGR